MSSTVKAPKKVPMVSNASFEKDRLASQELSFTHSFMLLKISRMKWKQDVLQDSGSGHPMVLLQMFEDWYLHFV